MRPSKRTLVLIASWMAFALVSGLSEFWLPEPWPDWLEFAARGAGLLLALAFLCDFFSRRWACQIDAERILPGSLALNAPNTVTLKITRLDRGARTITVTDHFPQQVDCHELPATLKLNDEGATLKYKVYPTKRGDATFGKIELQVRSVLGLWDFFIRCGYEQSIRVYPDFAAIVNFEALGKDQQVGQMGIHILQRRGEGLDFHQLREFRVGDSLRQVDWKATSRLRKPISREYQDERDQDIIFLMDCGRRMHTKDGQLSHFDHTLNAFLLMSYIALRQGDAVGLMTFAGQERWVPPLKGKENLSLLLNRVYDLHSTTEASDYLRAAQQLTDRFRKRSLVIVVTNIREEDDDDLQAAVALLKRYHLVMVASLREGIVESSLNKPIRHFDDALLHSSAAGWQYQRQQVLERLRHKGVIIADSLPHTMQIALVNEYYALKRSGRF